MLLTTPVRGIKEAETETEEKTEVKLTDVCHAFLNVCTTQAFGLHQRIQIADWPQNNTFNFFCRAFAFTAAS